VDEALPLRSATMADASAIRALTREASAKWVPVIGREPKPTTADYADAVQKHRIDLLYLDGELAHKSAKKLRWRSCGLWLYQNPKLTN
jgi:hypothetical protein